MSSFDDSFNDDDDDLILQLSNRPPRLIQAQTRSHLPTQVSENQPTPSNQATLETELIKAQGETSILRDKLHFLDNERKRERVADQSR